ncbi:DUF6277 family protein [Collimonas humicola]|uniref:DUF6277 family protein n=1 Tax=Collimonas humicola TaxID=2825886 RepID=UPI001B8D91B1|nr:DUF6277 family protein [Collimonas humicola]
MIDPKEILEATKSAQSFGQSASGKMSSSFTDGIASMHVASSQNVSNVLAGVQDIGQQMLGHMTAIKASVDEQVFSHQDKQQREKTYDFKPDMSDLRATDAQGFPQEMSDQFFAPFFGGNTKK